MSVAADPFVPAPSPTAELLPAVPPPLPPAVVVADRLRVTFGKLTALKDVSLRLGAGHLLGLIGPNGAGKTTLLRTLCGLQSLAHGRIFLLGEELSEDRPELLAQVGFTPDTPPAYNDLTVRQFLRFIGKGYGLAANDVDERIEFWLTKV